MEKISAMKKPAKTPSRLIDDSGQPVFGTFDKTFSEFNLLNFRSDSRIRRLFNWFRLTEWEAVEVISKKGAFLTAIYKFGILNIHLTVFFEKETGRIHIWNDTNLFQNRSHLAKTLNEGNVSWYENKHAKTEIVNRYDQKAVRCSGYSKNKTAGKIDFNFNLERISNPSIVSIPIKSKYPVYSEKDLFKYSGSIKLNDEEMTDDLTTIATIDDHRGYYPRKSGYDWLSTFKIFETEDHFEPFGLNITDFKLNPDQYDYHENGYWDESDFHALPIAHFQKDRQYQHITDSFGNIDIAYEIVAKHQVKLNLGLFKIEYQLNFGKVNGYIKKTNGQVVNFHDEIGLSEYRYTVI